MNDRVQIVATRALTYATRALVPGDVFEASAKDARLLKAIKKARDPDTAISSVQAPPKAVAQSIQNLFGGSGSAPTAASSAQVDMTALRDEYAEVVGKRAFHGWSADELRQRIVDHKAEQDAE